MSPIDLLIGAFASEIFAILKQWWQYIFGLPTDPFRVRFKRALSCAGKAMLIYAILALLAFIILIVGGRAHKFRE